MTTILSPPALLPQAQLGQAALAAVLLTQLPSELRQLVAGALLSGIVVGRDARGQTLLRTDAGIVSLRTPAPPPVGSAVMLEVQVVGTQVQAVILSITPPPPRTGTAAPGTPAPAQPPTAAAAQPQVPAPAPAPPGTISVAPGITTAPTLTAFVIAPSATPSTTVAAAPTATSSASPATVLSSPQPHSAPAPITVSASPILSSPASPPAAADPRNAGPLLVTSATAETSGPAGAAPTLPSTTTPSAPSPVHPTANEAPTRVAVAQADLAYRTAAGSAPLPPPSPASDAAVPPAPRPLVTAAAAPSLNLQGAAEIISRDDGPPPAPSGTAPVVPSKPLPVGTQIQLRLVSTAAGMPNAPIPPPASSAPGETAIIPAIVVGRVASGLTVVDTPIGRLAVPLSNAMPQAEPGARLWFATAGVGSPPTGLATASPPAVLRASQAALAHDWPTLKATLATLSAATQPTIRQLIEQALPRPGPRLAVQILSYIANGAAPDAHALLGGPALTVLERAGRGDLIARLDTDLAEMTKLSAASASEWRVAFVPICAGDMIHQLRVFTRRRRASTPRRDDAGKRFVVECDFTEFGPVQLDGLLNKPSLDLILRTHDDLPQAVQIDLGRLFAGSCGAAGLSGRLAFQSAATFPVSPLDEILGAGSALLV